MTAVRRDVAVVLAVQAVSAVLVAGWLATGHASAPDDGLLQLDGWAHIAATVGRTRLAVLPAVAGLVVVVVACLLARPLPTTLADHAADSAPVVAR